MERLILGLILTTLVGPVLSALCRSAPGDSDWPSADAWDSLNKAIGGRLLRPTPPGAVCHPSQASYNALQCASVQTAWFTEPLHSEDPVSVMWNNWNNETCLPDPRATCSSAGYPVYVVNATTAEHVKAGVDFARTHNLRLVIKNSGHDYIGRSSAPNALSIWVHHMKGIAAHETSYRPAGCEFDIPGHAITAGAGSQMQETYRATARMNRTVVGGNGRTVALGGFLTGGGHSILAPRFGMAADQVLEMQVVTAAGEIVTANECQNTDLFWAMRGGGGSTFGVLTSVTLQTIPSPRVATLNFQFAADASDPRSFDAATYFTSQLPRLGDAGVSGYPIIFKNARSSAANGPSHFTGVVGKLIMLDTDKPEDILAQVSPLFSQINSTWPGGFSFVTETRMYRSFGDWYEENYDPSPVGYNSVMGSRLLDGPALTGNTTALRAALEKFAAGGQATVYIVSGKGVWEAEPRGGGTSVNPAWRRTYVHATASVSFASLNSAAREDATRQTRGFAAALRELAPDTGAYVNEADRYEPDWQTTFWGHNYGRLLRIKRTVDPEDVFWCAPCVGNERWQEVDGRLCRI